MHVGVPVVALGAILISSCGSSEVAPGAPPPEDSEPVAALHPTPDVAFITISDVTADLVVSPEVPFPLLFDLPYGSHASRGDSTVRTHRRPAATATAGCVGDVAEQPGRLGTAYHRPTPSSVWRR